MAKLTPLIIRQDMQATPGIYNQCSTKDAPGVWYAACPGTGDWATDKANGDYAQATFSRLVVSDARKM